MALAMGFEEEEEAEEKKKKSDSIKTKQVQEKKISQ